MHCIQWGGIYLDTDVLLHNSLDDLLGYDCWLASDDVRYVATGLGFGACKGNVLIGTLMQAYASYEYPSGTNVIRDTKILERELTGWVKSNQNQVIDNTLIIGMRGYGAFARHLYLYTWADEDEKARRQNEIEENKPLKGSALLKWKFKCLVRSPRLINYFDKHKGSKAERLYTFMAYDFLDYGAWHFVKRAFRKLTGR